MTPFATLMVIALSGVASQVHACATLERFAQAGVLPTLNGIDASCSQSRVLGAGRSEDCFYVFPFRSELATQHFTDLSQQMLRCTSATRAEGSVVNHPDSFDQITGRIKDRDISLSLKDKGGLGQTLIVLRRNLP